MQSFERARLVAVDVVSELQPLGEPDEYVNLAPTTGPVPVMVPNAPRPAETTPSEMPVSETAEIEMTPDVGAAEVDADSEVGADDRVDADSGVEADDQADGGADEPVDDGAEEQSDVEMTAEEMTAEVMVEPEAEDARSGPVLAAGQDVADPDVAGDNTDSQEHDDVVVDLFARLRAEAVTIDPETPATVEAEIEPAIDAEIEVVAESEAEVESVADSR